MFWQQLNQSWRMTKLIGMLLAASGGIFPYRFDLGIEAIYFLPFFFSQNRHTSAFCLLDAFMVIWAYSVSSFTFHSCTLSAHNLLAVFWSVTFLLCVENGSLMNNSVKLWRKRVIKALLRSEFLCMCSLHLWKLPVSSNPNQYLLSPISFKLLFCTSFYLADEHISLFIAVISAFSPY